MNYRGSTSSRKGILGQEDENGDEGKYEEHGIFTASLDQKLSLSQLFLDGLHQSYNLAANKRARKSIMIVLVSLLELAPSRLIRDLDKSTLSWLLDLAHSQLLDISNNPGITYQHTTSLEGLRMLQALLRKSNAGTFFFSQIVRRGIYETVASISEEATSVTQSTTSSTFGSISSNPVCANKTLNNIASLFLHHFKLKNTMGTSNAVADQIRSIKEALQLHPSQLSAQNRIHAVREGLTKMMELMSSLDGITAHEFEKGDLAKQILSFLRSSAGDGKEVEERMKLFKCVILDSPHLKQFIHLLQEMIAVTIHLPLQIFNHQRGKPFHSLTQTIRLELWKLDGGDICSKNNSIHQESGRMIVAQPLVKFDQFQKAILKAIPFTNCKYVAYCYALIGHTIWRKLNNRWKSFHVYGYDIETEKHLIQDCREKVLFTKVQESRLREDIYKLGKNSISVKEIPSVDSSQYDESTGTQNAAASSSSVSTSSRKRKRGRSKDDEHENGITSIANSKVGDTIEFEMPELSSIFKTPSQSKIWYTGTVNHCIHGSDGICTRFVVTLSHATSGNACHKKDISIQQARLMGPQNTPQVGSVVELRNKTSSSSEQHLQRFGIITKKYNQNQTKTKEKEKNEELYDVKCENGKMLGRISSRNIVYPCSPSISSFLQKNVISSHSAVSAANAKIADPGERIWIQSKPQYYNSLLLIPGKVVSFDPKGGLYRISILPPLESKKTVIQVSKDRVIFLGSTSSLSSTNGSFSSKIAAALAIQQGAGSPHLASLIENGNNAASDDSTSMSGLQQRLHRALLSVAASSNSSPAARQEFSDSLDEFIRESEGSSSILTPPLSTTITANTPELEEEEDADEEIIQVDDDDNEDNIEPPSVPLNNHAVAKTTLDLLFELRKMKQSFQPFTVTKVPQISIRLGLRKLSKDNIITKKLQSNPCTALFQPGASSLQFTAKAIEAFQSIFKKANATSSLIDSSSDQDNGSPHTKRQRTSRRLQGLVPEAEAAAAASSLKSKSKSKKKQEKMVEKDDTQPFLSLIQFRRFVNSSFSKPMSEEMVLTSFSKFASPESRHAEMTWTGFMQFILFCCQSKSRAQDIWSCLATYHYTKQDFISSGDASTSSEGQMIQLQELNPEENLLWCLQQLYKSTDGSSEDQFMQSWNSVCSLFFDVHVNWKQKHAPAKKENKKNTLDEKKSPFDRIKLRKDHQSTALMDAVELLSILHSLSSPQTIAQHSSPDAPSVWKNEALCHRLGAQMDDVLAMASGTFPDWCLDFSTKLHFMFPYSLRMKLFRTTAFGWLRSLHWQHEQYKLQSHGDTSDDLQRSGSNSHRDEYDLALAPMKKDRVKVDKAQIIKSAENLMQLHAKRRAILDIVFVDEKGYGSGVTASFYSLVAAELQSIEENQKVSCW